MKKLLILLVLVGNVFGFVNGAKVILKKVSVGIFSTKSASLTDDSIKSLVKDLSKPKGFTNVNKQLADMHLSEGARINVYFRILIKQNKISLDKAKIMSKNLKNTEGFSSTLNKVIANNTNSTKGFLNELRIANNGVKNGYKVKSIGKSFNDGIKPSATDIDIILKGQKYKIIIEAKNITSTSKIKLDKFKGDLDTLIAYEKQNPNENILKIFTFTEKPSSIKRLESYKFWAKKKGVHLIFGTPAEQITQIKMLEEIL